MNPAQAFDPDRAEYLKVWGIADRISGKITGILQAELRHEAAILKELSAVCLQGMESYRKSQRLIM